MRLEGGQFFSRTARMIIQKYYSVEVGDYSYGPCMIPGALPPGTRVGRYCSIAEGLAVHRRNHPIERITQHPFFYNSSLGFVSEDTIQRNEDNPLIIGNDVWIGNRVTVLASCSTIGNGAVIGSGSVVTRDVEPYTVVAGMPAKRIRERFSPEIARWIDETKWWEKRFSELVAADIPVFEPLTEGVLEAVSDRLGMR